MIIWPIRIEFQPSSGYELSLGSSLARVGRLGRRTTAFYHIVSYIIVYIYILLYHIIISG